MYKRQKIWRIIYDERLLKVNITPQTLLKINTMFYKAILLIFNIYQNILPFLTPEFEQQLIKYIYSAHPDQPTITNRIY